MQPNSPLRRMDDNDDDDNDDYLMKIICPCFYLTAWSDTSSCGDSLQQ